ncbi:metallophosphoesterase [Methylosinus sp. C49]|uniref:metallophosphoesterase family protein n=1 Tax=Methylosinus sp. C49 TaxID=2699395 RepID=UPI001366B7D3|nr:metallophosphoesterase family protein [Methylosinus sp. C49]BBU63229.1 metallophosphoesterase [Methylosinus sp. C49]
MFFFRKPRSEQKRPEPRIPDGIKLYVIGDVHGRDDLPDTLCRSIEKDLAGTPLERTSIVFLGDYIDRGPRSAEVVERIVSGATPAPVMALRGNHEAILLQFLEDENVLDSWRRYGAMEALLSYGVDLKEVLRGRDFDVARIELRDKLPPAHLRFCEDTKLSWSLGDYFFCHAGCRPNVPLARQQEGDLLWIREEFLGFSGPWDKVIVHGHTPAPAPEELPHRINLDTGAYATGRLTCLVLEGATRCFLST